MVWTNEVLNISMVDYSDIKINSLVVVNGKDNYWNVIAIKNNIVLLRHNWRHDIKVFAFIEDLNTSYEHYQNGYKYVKRI